MKNQHMDTTSDDKETDFVPNNTPVIHEDQLHNLNTKNSPSQKSNKRKIPLFSSETATNFNSDSKKTKRSCVVRGIPLDMLQAKIINKIKERNPHLHPVRAEKLKKRPYIDDYVNVLTVANMVSLKSSVSHQQYVLIVDRSAMKFEKTQRFYVSYQLNALTAKIRIKVWI
ncbi:hypothetical protein PUN28_006163 [Cardiocondyla obscurior]|uniref:Uncharacterized protein n=1 Tax=Cardiocondyla obscurior TaxID=286306 RepID=A0AAW2GCE7_9HYME